MLTSAVFAIAKFFVGDETEFNDEPAGVVSYGRLKR